METSKSISLMVSGLKCVSKSSPVSFTLSAEVQNSCMRYSFFLAILTLKLLKLSTKSCIVVDDDSLSN